MLANSRGQYVTVGGEARRHAGRRLRQHGCTGQAATVFGACCFRKLSPVSFSR